VHEKGQVGIKSDGGQPGELGPPELPDLPAQSGRECVWQTSTAADEVQEPAERKSMTLEESKEYLRSIWETVMITPGGSVMIPRDEDYREYVLDISGPVEVTIPEAVVFTRGRVAYVQQLDRMIGLAEEHLPGDSWHNSEEALLTLAIVILIKQVREQFRKGMKKA
jgi:hypothetical protein